MARERDPEKTRRNLLHAAFEEIHKYGFQSASLDRILTKAEVTKGAMYHHFPNKSALGIAVVEELIATQVCAEWQSSLGESDDPIKTLIEKILTFNEMNFEEEVALGCPLNNLAQEMSAIDEGFREALFKIFKMWQQCIAESFERGQQAGTVRKDIDVTSTSLFIVAAFEGCISIIKTSKSKAVMIDCGTSLIHYLKTLRP